MIRVSIKRRLGLVCVDGEPPRSQNPSNTLFTTLLLELSPAASRELAFQLELAADMLDPLVRMGLASTPDEAA